MLKSSWLCLYSSNLGTFWLKIKQFWTFEEISIFSNGGHLGWRAWLLDITFNGNPLRMIQAKFGLNWPSGFRGEDFLKSLQVDDGRKVMAIAHIGELKNLRTIISNFCKIFWLLSHKHYLIPSLLIDIMIMTSLIKKINIQDIKSLVSKYAIMAWVSNPQFPSLFLK